MMQYVAPCTQDDPLSEARGLLFGSILSAILWAMIISAVSHLG